MPPKENAQNAVEAADALARFFGDPHCRTRSSTSTRFLRTAQIFSSAYLAFGYDGNDGQKTVAMRITALTPVSGFAAETSAATVIEIATRFGIPISTTHAISGAIHGVGSTRRLSAVRWGIAGRIVSAWVLTIPGCFVLGYGTATLLRAVGVHP